MNPLEDILIDRLVDDELSPTERRAALLALEDQPEGWRRCALAFLEAQAWGRELKGWPISVPANLPAPLSVAKTHRGMSASTWAALAAGLLIAFGLGTYVPRTVGPAPRSLATSPPCPTGE